MLKSINLFSVLFVTFFIEKSFALPAEQYNAAYFDELIKTVNSAGASWEAGHNFNEHVDVSNLVGSLDTAELAADNVKIIDKPCKHQLKDLSNESGEDEDLVGLGDQKVGHGGHSHAFDGFQAWENCSSVRNVWNQGRCASDWVIAPVSAIADRLCIASKGKYQEILSPEAPLACCKSCGWGCRKGYPSQVFQYFVDKGLVTGGGYKSKKGCQPYSIRPSHHAKSFMRASAPTPECKEYCTNSKYTKFFSHDRIRGKEAFRYTCPYCAASELANNGPLTATMNVYEDFLTYKSGIYHHVAGKYLGKLTVKIVGFNDDSNPKYWEAVNSWGTEWGDAGIFKIRRVEDECMIEGSLHGAYVHKHDHVDSDSSSSSSEGSSSSQEDD